MENRNLHLDCDNRCPEHHLLLSSLQEESLPESLRILYVLPVDFAKPSRSTVLGSATTSYVHEGFDDGNEDDRNWLSVMKERIEGFEQGIWIDKSAKRVYIWAWVSISCGSCSIRENKEKY